MSLINQRHERYEHAVANDANVVSALSADVAHTIELYDLSLQGVADDMRLPNVRALDPKTRQLVIFDHNLNGSFTGPIRVLDKTGMVVLDSRTIAPENITLSNQDFFKVFAEGKRDGLYISAPYTEPSGSYVVALSRAVMDDNANFSGVVVGTISLGYFNELFHGVRVSSKAAISIFRTDGTVIMRMPFSETVVGSSIADGGIFQRFPKSKSGHFEQLALMDGVKRIYSFSQVGMLPLLLNVGTPTNEIYAAWNIQAIVSGSLILGLFVMTLAGWFMLRQELRLRRRAEAALEDRANTDGLTGIANRRLFDRALDTEWRRASRTMSPLALLMIDADHFKAYNDRHGHQFGDHALQEIARSIAVNSNRSGTLCARYGGEEFVVLLADTDAWGAFKVAERIRSTLATTDHSVTVSIGVWSALPSAETNVEDLIRGADGALYQAKAAGRNCTFAEQVIASLVPSDWPLADQISSFSGDLSTHQ
jgi:diguanylate cyclase (GGDEF)-like protein